MQKIRLKTDLSTQSMSWEAIPLTELNFVICKKAKNSYGKGYPYSQIATLLTLHPMALSNAVNDLSAFEEAEVKLQELANEIGKEVVNE